MAEKKFVFKDWIVCFCDKDNKWQIFNNGQIINGNNFEKYMDAVNTIISAYKKEDSCIFISDLDEVSPFIKGFKAGKIKIGKNHSDMLSGKVGKCRVRNLDVFSADSMSEHFERDKNPAIYALEHLKTLDETPSFIKYSLGHMVKKKLVVGIEEDIVKEVTENHRWYDSIDMYKNSLCGRKDGLLIDLNFENDDVLQVDKKSAYLSKMLSYPYYPIGTIRESKRNGALIRVKEELSKWRNGEPAYFKVIIDTEYIPDLGDFSDPEDEKRRYAFLMCDDAQLQKHGIDLYELCEKYKDCIICQTCSKLGYLNKSYRDKLYNLFQQKESMSKDDPKRPFIKAQTELCYGKGLQDKRCDFHTKKLLLRYFVQPENYITPDISMLTCALVRMELFMVCSENSRDFTYCDTDSVHGIQTEEFENNIKKYNDEILKANEAAGYKGCKAGLWDIEHEHSTEYVFEKKQRIVKCDDKIIVKFAGLNQVYILNDFNKSNKDFRTYCHDLKRDGIGKIQISVALIHNNRWEKYKMTMEQYWELQSKIT